MSAVTPVEFVPFDPKQSCTLAGLEHWVKHAFEHLGWMVLAKSKNDDLALQKISVYKKSVDKLLEHLVQKEKEVSSPDSKQDLLVLIEKVKVLQAHLAQDFPMTGGKRKAKKAMKSKSRSRSRSKKSKAKMSKTSW